MHVSPPGPLPYPAQLWLDTLIHPWLNNGMSSPIDTSLAAPNSPPRLVRGLFEQFSDPRGALGRLAGRAMARSNVEANAWAAELLVLRAGDRVLDLGCGPGAGLAAAAAAHPGVVAVGVDRSPVMVAMARGRVDDVREGSAEALPLRDGSIDAAFAVNVVQFLDSPAAAIEELARVLAPGGRVALVFRLHDPRAGRFSPAAYGVTPERLEAFAAALAPAGFERPVQLQRTVDGEAHAALVATASR
jgi:SAM-dependent methyltransferase